MKPEDKIKKWKELGEMPNLFTYYKGYCVKGSFDYNNTLKYEVVIPTKDSIYFVTTKESFETDVQKHIDEYLTKHAPKRTEYIALVNGDNQFNGFIPDIDDVIISSTSLEEIRCDLQRFGQLNITESSKKSTLDGISENHNLSHYIPILISFEM